MRQYERLLLGNLGVESCHYGDVRVHSGTGEQFRVSVGAPAWDLWYDFVTPFRSLAIRPAEITEALNLENVSEGKCEFIEFCNFGKMDEK